MKKNKLFKLDNNQSTKQVSITMKKNKLFELKNNQSTKQVSITMKKISYSKSSEGIHSILRPLYLIHYFLLFTISKKDH